MAPISLKQYVLIFLFILFLAIIGAGIGWGIAELISLIF